MKKKILNWGILSTARIGERMIDSIKKSQASNLYGIASRDINKARVFGKNYGIPNVYGSYEDLLKDRNIDIIYISLPNHLHCEWAIKAARAKKNVLCEKPLAPSIREINSIIHYAKKYKVMIQEATMMRFHPQIKYVKKLIKDNKIGKIHYINAIFTITNFNYNDIRYVFSSGGGSLYDLGSYCLSFARYILDLEPKKVFANQEITKGKGKVDQVISGFLQFPNNIEMQFYSSMRSFPHENITIVGENGVLTLDLPYCNIPGESGSVSIIKESSTKKINYDSFGDTMRKNFSHINFNENAYDYEVESVNATVIKKTKQEITLEDSKKNIKTILALLKSAKKNKIINL
tara:strand:+ start:68 stop:1108 length:1041 start_codon:yes stop_codon:yes gene_type:complete